MPSGKFYANDRRLYEKFKDHVGANVDIDYKEQWRITYDKHGNEIKRDLIWRDVVDANLK